MFFAAGNHVSRSGWFSPWFSKYSQDDIAIKVLGILSIPVYCPFQPGLQVNFSFKCELGKSLGHFQTTTRLSIWFCWVPLDVTSVASELLHPVYEVSHPHFGAVTYIDRFCTIIRSGGLNNRFGTVIHVQKFARSGAGAPNSDAFVPISLRIQALFDQCRNDVRGSWVKIVSGTIQIRRQKVYHVCTVLLSIGLPLYKQNFPGST